MKVKLSLLVPLLVVLTLLAFPSCKKKGVLHSFRTTDAIKASGQLRIAAYSDRPPLSWSDDELEYHGFFVYFARQLAADLGVKPVFFHIKPADLADALETGQVDMGASLAETPGRVGLVAYTLPYMKTCLSVASPALSPITSVEELRDKRLIVEVGSVAEDYFSENHPDVTLVSFALAPQMYQALRDGRGDALCATGSTVMNWVSGNPDFVVGIKATGDPGTVAACTHKDNQELLQWLNGEIRTHGAKHFFLEDFEATLRSTYGEDADPYDHIIEEWP